MNQHSEFWSTLDRIADELAQEGSDNVSRAENITTALETFPKTKRTACLKNLAQVAESLPLILTLCQNRDGESG